jgi:hypothetical protein
MIELVPINEPKKKVEILVPDSTLSMIDDRRKAFAFRNRTAFLVEAALHYGSSSRIAEVELLADIADTLHQLHDFLHDSGAAPVEIHTGLHDVLAKADAFFARHMPPRED